jgi:hypothetical protein
VSPSHTTDLDEVATDVVSNAMKFTRPVSYSRTWFLLDKLITLMVLTNSMFTEA